MGWRAAWRTTGLAFCLALGGSALPLPAASVSDFGHAVLPSAASRPLPDRLRGLTIDTTARLSATIASLRALHSEPTVRLVLDPATLPADYAPAIKLMRPAAYVMAELLDSGAVKGLSLTGVRNRARSFGKAFAGQVDLWEIGNEVNGEWVGRGQAEIDAKVAAAFDVIHGELHAPTALTLNYWAGPQCYAHPWEATLAYAAAMPERVRTGVDYVFLSLYETACDPVQRPTASQLIASFRELARIFPQARLGIGEIGAQGREDGLPLDPVLADKQRIAARYYGMDAALRARLGPRFVGGYFWWYYLEDAVPMRRPASLWPTLDELLAGLS